MASAFKKSGNRWFVRFKTAEGKWVSRRVEQGRKSDAMAVARVEAAREERIRMGIDPAPASRSLCRELMRQWARSLTNRAASDDRSRLENHVIPRFGTLPLRGLTKVEIMKWLDADDAPPAPTLRHCLGLISRFFNWAIARGLAPVNPIRSLLPSERPATPTKPTDAPWISDDGTVRALMAALPAPFNLMFYVGNRAGLRTGEICGLRLSDVEDIAKGAIRVRYSYAGCLKEDRRQEGKTKWAPAPSDAVTVLGPWIARRRADGAGPEDFLFPRDGRHYRKEHVTFAWQRARRALGLTLSWYEGTRHSFASRNLSRGVGLDEVAAAMGHSTPAITARHYAHFVRKTFAPLMTAPLESGLRLVPPKEPARAHGDGNISRLETEGGEHVAA